MNVNGKEGDLVIESIDAQGVVTGMLFGAVMVLGLWNETSQTITFTVAKPSLTAVNLYDPYLFRGFLFSTPTEPPEGEDVLWTLEGSVSNPAPPNDAMVTSHVGANGTARRNEFGWFAQLNQVV